MEKIEGGSWLGWMKGINNACYVAGALGVITSVVTVGAGTAAAIAYASAFCLGWGTAEMALS